MTQITETWVERWWRLPTGLSVDPCLWIFLRPSTCGMMSGGVAGQLVHCGQSVKLPQCHRYVLYKLTFDLCSHTTSHFYHTHNTAVWYTGGKCTQTSIPFIYVPGPEIWGHRLEWTTNCQRVWLPTVDPNGYDYWSLPCWHFNWNVNSMNVQTLVNLSVTDRSMSYKSNERQFQQTDLYTCQTGRTKRYITIHKCTHILNLTCSPNVQIHKWSVYGTSDTHCASSDTEWLWYINLCKTLWWNETLASESIG